MKQELINAKNITSLLDGFYNLPYSVKEYQNVLRPEYQGVYDYVAPIVIKLGFNKAVEYFVLTNQIDQDSGFWEDFTMNQRQGLIEQLKK